MCCYDWGCKKIWKSNSFRISYDGMLLQAGFMNKEIIIKEQHNCCSTEYWETKIIIFTSGTRVHICFQK